MLNEEEFRSKTYVIMDKPTSIIVMSKKLNGYWLVISANKDEKDINIDDNTLMNEVDAYAYYEERMASFGYRMFTVITK